METGEIHTSAAHRVVATCIHRWVALGEFAPGDRLPTERELASRLGTGRQTVRHAIRLLAAEGLVSTQRGRSGGTFVLDDQERPMPSAAVTERLLADVRENFDFRLGVEPLAARFAAERADKKDRWAIRGLAEGQAGSIRGFRMLDSRFHHAVAQGSQNALLVEAVGQSRADFFRWADAAWMPMTWDELPTTERDFAHRHRPIAEAILHGAGEEAEAEMARHLAEGKAQFLAAIAHAATPARKSRTPGVRASGRAA